MSKHDHFEGAGVKDHLKRALLKGRRVQEHTHTPPLPSHLFAMGESMKEITILLSLLFLLSTFIHHLAPSLPLFAAALTLLWTLYKAANNSLVAFEKLGRLHQLVEEEHHEIKHNRPQEREELTAMYRLKGFEEPLLPQVIDVLMADDHRLLMVMLEEELGMQLESEEHPIKRGLFTSVGTLIIGTIATLGFCFFPSWLNIALLAALFCGCSIFSAYVQAVRKTQSVIWSIAIGAVSLGLSYVFLSSLIQN
ncbi:hypothetical protein COB21_04260 [Candidatus Aerophobetes bacterium]|uniref:VIT family protein n=1 Tax=Aerophobetes bacterium TaxID=2030807 RepID=A0A2A4X1Y8_UNCAE|nr:MAG: hypothetical protein COB21_04260 [Candidatus Aerophobetes bacterium]